MTRRTLILPIGAGVIGMDDVPLVRIMDSDETPTSITAYGVVDTVQPVLSVTWTVNGVEQEGDVTKSPVLELTDLQPETSYAITLRATNVNGESQASTRTIWTKKITTITPADVVDGVTYYDYQDVYRTGTMPERDETDITVSGRDVTVPAGHYADSETVSVSSEYIIPTGTKNINANGTDDVTQYASVNVNVPASAVDTGTKQTNITTNGTQTFDVVGYANNEVTVNVQPNLETANITPSTSPQTIVPTGNVDGYDRINVSAVTGAIDPNITPSNIKEGVTILGVTGTFEGGIQPSGTLNIVNNGIYDITNYANVNVNVVTGDNNFLCFTANEANCTVGMSHYGTNATTTKPVIYYSTDGRLTWTSWDGTTITLANQNDKVYFYGDNLDGFGVGNSNYSKFTATGDLTLSGNIMTLITVYGDREYIPTSYCFYYLFSGTTITDASNLLLPATQLKDICYSGLFKNCRNLTSAPQTLPATTLKYECYSVMFDGCTSLTTAPSLPATTLGGNCYQSMFRGCTSLTTAPELPATALAGSCYDSMFNGCASLTTAPALPATTLANSCYKNMFQNCTSLTIAPELPATTLVNYCYDSMFKGCSSLNSITINTESWNTSWVANWVNNVSGTGTFVKPYDLQIGTGTGQIPLDSASGIPVGWTVKETAAISDDNEYITFNISSGYDIYYTTDGTTPTTSSTLYTGPISVQGLGDTFTLKYISTDNNGFVSPVGEYKYYNMFYIEALENNTVLNLSNWKKQYSWSALKVQYSTNKNVWADVDNNMSSYTLSNTGDKVYFRRATPAASTDTGNVWNQGNLNAVTSGTIKVGGCLEYACYLDITGNRPASVGCGNMFQSCTGLVDASKLKLFGSVYKDMFNGCTSLTSPPALQSTTVVAQSYYGMFSNCTSLTTSPALPATTLGGQCYTEMFNGCTSLTTAPAILPATTLVGNCYSNMFYGCTSLVSAPELPATTLVNGCYSNMFRNCSSLNHIKVRATTWNTSYTNQWTENVASTGTFIKPSSLVIGTGTGEIPADSPNGIPVGWTAVEPTPSTQNMFYFTAVEPNVDIAYTHPNDLGFTPKFYASTDGVNFTQMTKQVPVTLSNIGDKLYIYGDNQYLCNQTDISKYAYFLMSGGDVTVGGDLTTLLDVNGLTTLPDRAFVATLQSTYLISAADLTVNVTSVGDYALYKLFEGNTNMTSGINALPATTLGDYCYARMYYGCEKLTTTPTTLPATTLTDSCYRAMYYGCELITNAPSLPATTLAASCYEDMFNGCVALQNVTATLPATTTASRCYYGMFNNCDSLQTAPEIYATAFTPSEFSYMFKSCNALNSITVRCTSWDTSTDSRWVENVSASGTFTKPTATVIPSGMNGIPTGWTVVDF